MNHLLSLQLVFFSKNLEFFYRDKKPRFLADVQSHIGLKKGESTILPIPEDSPEEIPRMILEFQDEAITINFTQNRIQYFYLADEKEDIDVLIEKQLEYIRKLFDILELLDVKIESVGIILRTKLGELDFLDNLSNLLSTDTRTMLLGSRDRADRFFLRTSVTEDITEDGTDWKLFKHSTVSSSQELNGVEFVMVDIDLNSREESNPLISRKEDVNFIVYKAIEFNSELIDSLTSILKTVDVED